MMGYICPECDEALPDGEFCPCGMAGEPDGWDDEEGDDDGSDDD